MTPAAIDPYRVLQQHLDSMPVRFPKTKSGVELRILKRLFTGEEARIALAIDHVPRPTSGIMGRMEDDLGLDATGLEAKLEVMARKGCIMAITRDGQLKFSTHPWVAGMYEIAAAREMSQGIVSRELIEDCSEYSNPRYAMEMLAIEKRAFRTIPIEQALTPDHPVATYDQLTALIDASKRFGVLKCVCKEGRRIRDDPCKRTTRIETCMVFNDYADFGIDSGLIREVSKPEMLEIARLSEQEGLVLQPENTQRPNFICACCDDCCGFLHLLKAMPRPVDFASSNFHASIDNGACTGCGTCARRCHMEAITLKDKTAAINLARCIGCGACVPGCKPGAITLVKNEKDIVPELDFEAYMNYLDNHRQNGFQRAAKFMKAMFKIPVARH